MSPYNPRHYSIWAAVFLLVSISLKSQSQEIRIVKAQQQLSSWLPAGIASAQRLITVPVIFTSLSNLVSTTTLAISDAVNHPPNTNQSHCEPCNQTIINHYHNHCESASTHSSSWGDWLGSHWVDLANLISTQIGGGIAIASLYITYKLYKQAQYQRAKDKKHHQIEKSKDWETIVDLHLRLTQTQDNIIKTQKRLLKKESNKFMALNNKHNAKLRSHYRRQTKIKRSLESQVSNSHETITQEMKKIKGRLNLKDFEEEQNKTNFTKQQAAKLKDLSSTNTMPTDVPRYAKPSNSHSIKKAKPQLRVSSNRVIKLNNRSPSATVPANFSKANEQNPPIIFNSHASEKGTSGTQKSAPKKEFTILRVNESA